MPTVPARPFSSERKTLPLALCLAAALTLAACGTTPRVAQSPTAPALRATTGDQYLSSAEAEADARRRLTTLASDAMAGREAGTEGERLAAAFLAEELEALGVAPGGDLVDGGRSYVQTVAVDTYQFDLERTAFAVDGGPEAVLGDDWIAFPEYTPSFDASGVPLVFPGYGLYAPDQGHDDYAGIDVRGRVVLVASGSPAGIDSVAGIQGPLDADSFLPKYIAAAQRGAAAIVVVASDWLLESWDLYRGSALTASMELAGTPLQANPIPLVYVHPAFASRLLRETGGPADALERAAAGEPLTAFTTEQPVTLRVVRSAGTAETHNVVGLVRGDEEPDEFVAFGAHYDHEGTVDGEIFNGADDNASGVTAVLAVAEALAADAATGDAPDRSALFVFHTAEEKGLQGSEFFAANPERSVAGDLDRVVAQINLDMVAREHPDSLYVIGASRLSTTFGRTVETANRALGEDGAPLFTFDFTFDDPDHPENLYQRSDHYSYAKRGVPVVFMTDGMGANWAKGLERDDYHRPDDDIEFIDFAKLVRVARLAYAIGRATADTNARPEIDRPVESTP